VSQVDIMPTTLDVASIPPPTGLQGTSLRKLEESPPRFLVSESYPRQWLVGLNRQYGRVEQALIFENRKLVESTSGKRELYDLSHDANEEHNLYQDGDPTTLVLSEMLQQWAHKIPAGAFEDRGSTDRNTIQRLKSLGYAQ
jgi:arylsulfatase A-like enzyme